MKTKKSAFVIPHDFGKYIGAMLEGTCGGYFGESSILPKRIECIGEDWLTARALDGIVEFLFFPSSAALGLFLLDNVHWSHRRY